MSYKKTTIKSKISANIFGSYKTNSHTYIYLSYRSFHIMGLRLRTDNTSCGKFTISRRVIAKAMPTKYVNFCDQHISQLFFIKSKDVFISFTSIFIYIRFFKDFFEKKISGLDLEKKNYPSIVAFFKSIYQLKNTLSLLKNPLCTSVFYFFIYIFLISNKRHNRIYNFYILKSFTKLKYSKVLISTCVI